MNKTFNGEHRRAGPYVWNVEVGSFTNLADIPIRYRIIELLNQFLKTVSIYNSVDCE